MEIPQDFPKMTLTQFMDRILATFPGEDILMDEAAWKGWRPIINVGDETMDQNHRNAGIGRYSSTPWLTSSHLEDSGERIPVAVRRAYLDVWVGWLLALMNLDNYGTWPCIMPRSGGRFLVTGNKCPDQCGHNDFVARKEGSPGYFCIITGSHPVTLWVSRCSHIFVWYSEERKEALVNALVMEEIIIPVHSVLLRYQMQWRFLWDGHWSDQQ